MAETPAGRALTEAHRLAQARIGAQIVAQMLRAWRLIDFNDIEATTTSWLSVALPLVTSLRAQSDSLSAAYLTRFRAAEVGSPASWAPALAPAADIAALRKSLIVTGPARLQNGVRAAMPLDAAVRTAQVAVARSAKRLVLDGGRDRIEASIAADRTALGWARATSSGCCAFCAMLASRGGVYKTERSGGFRPHDGCGCTPEPIYRRGAALPAGSEGFQDLWYRSTRGLSSDDAQVAFRRAIEGRDAPEGWDPRRTSTRARPPLPAAAGGDGVSAAADPQARARAELSALEKRHDELLSRQAAGEDVSGPLAWQEDRMARLREQV